EDGEVVFATPVAQPFFGGGRDARLARLAGPDKALHVVHEVRQVAAMDSFAEEHRCGARCRERRAIADLPQTTAARFVSGRLFRADDADAEGSRIVEHGRTPFLERAEKGDKGPPRRLS